MKKAEAIAASAFLWYSVREPEFGKEVGAMFREMRRYRQQLAPERCDEILERGTSGVLALSGDGGYPYAVPVSYVYDRRAGKIYFHSAKVGHKVDSLRRCDKASFCVVDRDQVVPEAYTTWFRSVIAFGRMRILEEDGEKLAAIQKLARKYHPTDSDEGRQAAIDREWAPLCMLELTIEHLTGKEAKELAQRRQSEHEEEKK